MSQPIDFWWEPIVVPKCGFIVNRTPDANGLMRICGAPAMYEYTKSGDYSEFRGAKRCAEHVPKRPPDPNMYRDGRGLWCCAKCVLDPDWAHRGFTSAEALAHLEEHTKAGHDTKSSVAFVNEIGDP